MLILADTQKSINREEKLRKGVEDKAEDCIIHELPEMKECNRKLPRSLAVPYTESRKPLSSTPGYFHSKSNLLNLQ